MRITAGRRAPGQGERSLSPGAPAPLRAGGGPRRAGRRARPRWTPGQVPAYQVIAYGFVLGELARRVTGRPPGELLTAELLAPLGLHDTHPGLPDELWHRHVPVRGRGRAGLLTQYTANRRRVRPDPDVRSGNPFVTGFMAQSQARSTGWTGGLPRAGPAHAAPARPARLPVSADEFGSHRR
ncbi:beta-lactamase family protein [Streptacidiphilus sp. P02-A3a]|nr:beta-lactamase family protein [Streptacidiphilus sp. P02-A3a]